MVVVKWLISPGPLNSFFKYYYIGPIQYHGRVRLRLHGRRCVTSFERWVRFLSLNPFYRRCPVQIQFFDSCKRFRYVEPYIFLTLEQARKEVTNEISLRLQHYANKSLVQNLFARSADRSRHRRPISLSSRLHLGPSHIVPA